MSEQPNNFQQRISEIFNLLFTNLVHAVPAIRMPRVLNSGLQKRLASLRGQIRKLLERGPAKPRNKPQQTAAETPPKPTKPRTPPPFNPANPHNLQLPGNFGWFWRMFQSSWVNTAKAQLKTLLESEETQSLLAENPSLGRHLRPLCHMLGLKPPGCLRRTPRPRAPRPPSAMPAATASASAAQKPKIPRKIWRPHVPTPLTPAQQRLMLAQMLSTRQILS